jgi:O-antigen ligase
MSKSDLQPILKAVSAEAAHESPWRSRAGLGIVFLGLVLVGLIVSAAGRNLADRFGGPAVFLLILVCPVLLIGSVVAFRQGLSKFRTFRMQLTWWHWLWLVIVASNFVFRTRDFESAEQQPLDLAAIYRISLVGITAFLLTVRLVLKRPNWLGSLFRGLVGIMAAFALICVLSSIWSVNPPWTLYKSLEYLVDVSLLAAILATVQSTESLNTLLDWTWLIIGGLVVTAWVEAPIWPAEALEGAGGYMGGPLQYRLSGVYPGQGYNMLGTYGAILGTIAICRLLSVRGKRFDRAWYGMVLVLASITMIFAQTRSAIAGFVVGVLLVLIFTKRVGLGMLLGATSAVAMVLTGAGRVVLEFLERGQTHEQITSLSARIDWWTVAWEAFKLHPFRGYGAFAAAMVVFPKLGVKEITPLHSDYVEALVGTGIWGPLLLIASLLGAWWVLVRFIWRVPWASAEHQLAVEAIAVLGVLSVRSVVMGVIASHPPYQYLAILGCAEYLRRRYGRGSPAMMVGDGPPQSSRISARTSIGGTSTLTL